jgi:acylphosphatase
VKETALRVTVHGRVQGVFYRDWTVRTARALGLTGWVRNEAGGTVEALLQGEDAAVRRMIGRMHEGPPAARVEGIDERESAAEVLADFSRR